MLTIDGEDSNKWIVHRQGRKKTKKKKQNVEHTISHISKKLNRKAEKEK